MLKDILKIIGREGYISKSMLAGELHTSEKMVDEGIKQLLRMGYISEEETGKDCTEFCAKCQFAQNCGKEIVKTFKISEKGSNFL